MCRFLPVLVLVIGFPLSGFAQFVDRGEYVEVSKGVKLCFNADLDTLNGMLDPEKRFWRVTSKVRANGTQTVAAFVLESEYNRQRGESTMEERQYDKGYAIRSKRAVEHTGMRLMVSPREWSS